jgi:hypothetical protein
MSDKKIRKIIIMMKNKEKKSEVSKRRKKIEKKKIEKNEKTKKKYFPNFRGPNTGYTRLSKIRKVWECKG